MDFEKLRNIPIYFGEGPGRYQVGTGTITEILDNGAKIEIAIGAHRIAGTLINKPWNLFAADEEN